MTLQKDLSINAKKLLNVSEDDLDVILKNSNVSKESLGDMIKSIRDWYEKQPHLPQGHLHDRVIIGHLISRSFSIERVKEKIDNCLMAKSRMPDMVCDRDPSTPQLDKYLRQGYWAPLPRKTSENYRVGIFRIDKDSDASVSDIMKIAFMLVEYRLWNDIYTGDIWLMDFTNVNISHALQMTPVVISKLMFFMTGCFGVRVRSIHLINLPSYASTALNLFKRAMHRKLIQRIHIHNNIEEALEQFPIEMVPRDFGGKEISMQEIADEWANTFQTKQWKEYFIEQDSIRTDESKRVVKTAAEDFFGIDGSFRKLNLD